MLFRRQRLQPIELRKVPGGSCEREPNVHAECAAQSEPSQPKDAFEKHQETLSFLASPPSGRVECQAYPEAFNVADDYIRLPADCVVIGVRPTLCEAMGSSGNRTSPPGNCSILARLRLCCRSGRVGVSSPYVTELCTLGTNVPCVVFIPGEVGPLPGSVCALGIVDYGIER